MSRLVCLSRAARIGPKSRKRRQQVDFSYSSIQEYMLLQGGSQVGRSRSRSRLKFRYRLQKLKSKNTRQESNIVTGDKLAEYEWKWAG